MDQLQKKLTDILAAIAEASECPVPDGALEPQVPYDLLGDTDVLLRVDIRLYTRSGEEFKVAGINTAPNILSDEMHLESPHVFSDMYAAAVSKPVLSKFNAFLGKYTKADTTDNIDTMMSMMNAGPTLNIGSSDEPVLDAGFLTEEESD